MVFLDNTARRPTQNEVISGRINPSPTRTCNFPSGLTNDFCNTNLHDRIRQICEINAERGNLGTDKSVPYKNLQFPQWFNKFKWFNKRVLQHEFARTNPPNLRKSVKSVFPMF
ncbi:MAG: hypothetical protein FWG87_02030 [Defluviitaleaceae bacterium]|nr:hypothetical protein [Defluviitaleaceae bacterium]